MFVAKREGFLISLCGGVRLLYKWAGVQDPPAAGPQSNGNYTQKRHC